MFDANGLSGNRWTAEMNLKLAEQNGFGKIGKMQIVSEENYINLPVKNPYVLKRMEEKGIKFEVAPEYSASLRPYFRIR